MSVFNGLLIYISFSLNVSLHIKYCNIINNYQFFMHFILNSFMLFLDVSRTIGFASVVFWLLIS